MSISNKKFREALGCFASGITVITTKDSSGKLHGLTVSAFSSVSMNPPLVLICIDKKTASYHAFEESGCFVVNILGEDQQDVSSQFASPIEDKFAGIDYSTNGDQLPILKNAAVNLECDLKNSYDGGDHTIFVGEVKKASVSEKEPLVYCHGKYRRIV